VELFYNSSRTESQASYIVVSGLLTSFKDAQFTLFSINAPGAGAGAGYDLATSQDSAGQMYGYLLPMLMMIFLFSGCMAVAPESIAGEKERGTIATLLVTPLKRWELALGKVISLSCIAVLAGASSFIGTMLSLPNMMGQMPDEVSAALYSPLDYAMLFVIIISTVLLFVSLISLISAFAKTIKEASSLVMPLMIVVMLVGVLGMFGTAQENPLFYLIPAYNSVQCMVGIFSFSYQLPFVAITAATNLLVAAASIIALTKMFNSEKVIFSR
jgi:sodium transport system permease protein